MKDIEGGYLFRISLGYLKDITGYLKKISFEDTSKKDIRDVIQVGVNVAGSRKKKPSVSVPVAGPWAAAGARPVYKMYARPSCFSSKF